MATSFVLASRSPRRLELLQLLVPADCISVIPPRDAVEAGFDGLTTLEAIQTRLVQIARSKAQDVAQQTSANADSTSIPRVIIAADTTVVVTATNGALSVLGQPPEDESWQDVVRHWFRAHYAGRTHLALTALCVRGPDGKTSERIVTTEVTFIADVEKHLDWYIGTGEPRGKAGAYAIQGAGSIFVSRIVGSLSNVIGLPLEALLEIFEEIQIQARQ